MLAQGAVPVLAGLQVVGVVERLHPAAIAEHPAHLRHQRSDRLVGMAEPLGVADEDLQPARLAAQPLRQALHQIQQAPGVAFPGGQGGGLAQRVDRAAPLGPQNGSRPVGAQPRGVEADRQCAHRRRAHPLADLVEGLPPGRRAVVRHQRPVQLPPDERHDGDMPRRLGLVCSDDVVRPDDRPRGAVLAGPAGRMCLHVDRAGQQAGEGAALEMAGDPLGEWLGQRVIAGVPEQVDFEDRGQHGVGPSCGAVVVGWANLR